MCIISAAAAGSAAAAAMANVSIGVAAVSGVVGAYGAYQQGQQQKAMYEYEAEMAEENARIAELQAQDAINRGSKERAALQQRLGETRSTGRAMWGASGVKLDEGSPLDWQVDMAEREKSDEMILNHNINKEAWAYRVDSANSKSQANAAYQAGQNASRAGMFSAGASLLSSAGTVASRYYKFTS